MKIFISYSKSDKSFARKLRRDLNSLGYDVWMDEKSIPVGGSISPSIQKGISESEFVILVISPDALSSGWVEAEWNAVYSNQISQRKIKLLPMLRKETFLPEFLANLLYADANENYATALAKVIQSIERKESIGTDFEIFEDNEQFQKKYSLSKLLDIPGREIVFCGFTHASSLFNYDDDRIAKWVETCSKFEIFIVQPEHSDQSEWLPRIKHYKKKFSYNQIDGVLERCKNVRERLTTKAQKKYHVYLLDLPRVNLLNLKKIDNRYFCRFIGFAQMGNISPSIEVNSNSKIGKFFTNYIDNLRKYDEFWKPLEDFKPRKK